MGERWTVYVFALVMKKSGRMCKLLEQSGSIEGVIQPSEHPRGLSNASCIAPEAPSSHLAGSGHHLVLSSYLHNLQGCRNSKVQLGNRDAHGGAKTGDADDQKTRLNACFLTATPSPDCGSGTLSPMAVTMDVDGDDYKPPDEFPIHNGHELRVLHSPLPSETREFIAPTAQSPPPPPESSTQTPAPVPEPTPPQGPYRPNYKPHVMLSGHTRSISSVRFSPNGATLASCGKCQLRITYCGSSRAWLTGRGK